MGSLRVFTFRAGKKAVIDPELRDWRAAASDAEDMRVRSSQSQDGETGHAAESLYDMVNADEPSRHQRRPLEEWERSRMDSSASGGRDCKEPVHRTVAVALDDSDDDEVVSQQLTHSRYFGGERGQDGSGSPNALGASDNRRNESDDDIEMVYR